MPSAHPEMDDNKRYRDPVLEEEIAVRVREYTEQVERHGRITRFHRRRA